MAQTATYTATMVSRFKGSSSNKWTNYAGQGYYGTDSSHNHVGILNFASMSLQNKVITAVSITVKSEAAGLYNGTAKTVHFRKSNYQYIASGVTGTAHAGDELGTFSGYFPKSSSATTDTINFTGSLLTNVAAYISAGNNTFTLYNPSPTMYSNSYTTDYMKWSSCTMTVTYEEGVSTPSVSSSSVTMGNSVTIYTNRLSDNATHTVSYSFAGATGTIGSNVGASIAWTVPTSLASNIPTATSGTCTITCTTYYNGTAIGSRTCVLTLNVPSANIPTVDVTQAEATSGLATQFGVYVQGKSTVKFTISASGSGGSTISKYSTVVNGSTYTASSFTTGVLKTAGTNSYSVTVTDSRGRTATNTGTFTVYEYSVPKITKFTGERCDSTGSTAQLDGTKARITASASVSPVNNKNTMTVTVYYKASTATSWTSTTTLTPSNFAVSATNRLLSPTFSTLTSYDLKIAVKDFFTTVEMVVGLGTSRVPLDVYRDGTGIAFGKIAEQSGVIGVGLPMVFDDSGAGSSQTVRSSTMKNLTYYGWDPGFSDTTAEWSSRGFCQVMCTSSQTKISQPVSGIWALITSWGMYGTGSDVFQICHEQPNGRIWIRGGNTDGFGAWKQIPDTASANTWSGKQTYTGGITTNAIEITGTYYPSFRINPTQGTALAAFEGSYVGEANMQIYDNGSDSTNRRILSQFSATAKTNLNNAQQLRTCANDSWNTYDIYHAGMTNAVRPSDTGWISLTLASGVSAATQYAEYFGAAYRVVNGNHVYVRCGVSFNYAGARVALTSGAIPSAYRPQHGAYAFCVGTLSRLYRIVVNTSGIIELEWANTLGSSSTTNSFSVSWMDGRLDYFI